MRNLWPPKNSNIVNIFYPWPNEEVTAHDESPVEFWKNPHLKKRKRKLIKIFAEKFKTKEPTTQLNLDYANENDLIQYQGQSGIISYSINLNGPSYGSRHQKLLYYVNFYR